MIWDGQDVRHLSPYLEAPCHTLQTATLLLGIMVSKRFNDFTKFLLQEIVRHHNQKIFIQEKKANFFFKKKKSFDFTKDNYYYSHFLLKNDNIHQCKPIIFFWDSISKRDECGQKVLHTVLDTVVDVDFVDFFIFAKKKKNGRTSIWRIISSLSDMIS